MAVTDPESSVILSYQRSVDPCPLLSAFGFQSVESANTLYVHIRLSEQLRDEKSMLGDCAMRTNKLFPVCSSKISHGGRQYCCLGRL